MIPKLGLSRSFATHQCKTTTYVICSVCFIIIITKGMTWTYVTWCACHLWHFRRFERQFSSFRFVSHQPNDGWNYPLSFSHFPLCSTFDTFQQEWAKQHHIAEMCGCKCMCTNHEMQRGSAMIWTFYDWNYLAVDGTDHMDKVCLNLRVHLI